MNFKQLHHPDTVRWGWSDFLVLTVSAATRVVAVVAGDTSRLPDGAPLHAPLHPQDGQNICHDGCRCPSVVRASGEGAACSASRHGTHGYLQQRCSLTGKWGSSRSKLSSGFRQKSAPARLFRTAAVTSPSASPILCPRTQPPPEKKKKINIPNHLPD